MKPPGKEDRLILDPNVWEASTMEHHTRVVHHGFEILPRTVSKAGQGAGCSPGGPPHNQPEYSKCSEEFALFRPGEAHNLHARIHKYDIAGNSPAQITS